VRVGIGKAEPNYELRIAHPNLCPVGDGRLAPDALAIQIRSIAAAEIHHHHLVAGGMQDAMVPAHGGIAQPQIAVGTSANEKISLLDRQLASRVVLAARNDEPVSHRQLRATRWLIGPCIRSEGCRCNCTTPHAGDGSFLFRPRFRREASLDTIRVIRSPERPACQGNIVMSFQFDMVSAGQTPAPASQSQGEVAGLLREILDVQREQLAFLRAAHDASSRWRAFLARWREDFPDLSDACREVLPVLERTYGALVGELAQYIRQQDGSLDNDFTLQEFLDRYGMRLAQLGTLLNLVAPLAEASPSPGEASGQ